MTHKVQEIKPLLEVQIKAAIQEEEEDFSRCQNEVLRIQKEQEEVKLNLIKALDQKDERDACHGSGDNITSWEIEDSEALLFQLDRELSQASNKLKQRMNIAKETDENLTASDVIIATQRFIDASRLKAQANVDVIILEINLLLEDGRKALIANHHHHHLSGGAVLANHNKKLNNHDMELLKCDKQEIEKAKSVKLDSIDEFFESSRDLEYFITCYNNEIEIYHTDYIPLPKLREDVCFYFQKYEKKIENGIGVKKKGDVGYYKFKESSLGRVLINQYGVVAPEFRSHEIEIDRYKELDDRPAWGGTV